MNANDKKTVARALAAKSSLPKDDFQPFNLDENDETEALQHHLFTSHGVDYFMPEPSGALALKALDLMAERGEAIAVNWAVKELLGPDTYAALLASSITGPQLKALVSHIGGMVFGAAEGN
jgi:hypothetical protein